ncbi:general secretion pathway protein GspK [Methylobacterium sp. Leaf113]|uniref:general secretion pathway protein GspK n=1 Tax=Methylobacterium sp. Leaf113 TaxID=1736259 RepID=UPI000A98A6A7|nr:type II secretion system protein GspK [Methylobacterium sp. Leaf113]
MGALLTSVALTAMRGFSASLRAAAIVRNEVQVEELGRSGIDLALANLTRLDPQDRLSGRFAVTLETGAISVEFTSETARADVNSASPQVLAALLIGIGLDHESAQRLGSEIADWREPQAGKRSNVAPDEAYRDRGRSVPAQRPFSDTVEIAEVLDMTPEILAGLLPLVTVCSGQAKIDPVIADEAMLRALFGGDAHKAQSYRDPRQYQGGRRGDASRRADVLAPFPDSIRPMLAPDSDPGRGVRLRIVARAGPLERRYDVSACPEGGSGGTIHLRSWRAL